MRARFGSAVLGLAFFCSAPARAGLVFVAPNVAVPPSVTLANGNVGVADPLQLSGKSAWSGILEQTLTMQGFTADNGWSYSTTNITPLANNYQYTVANGGAPVVGYKLQSSGGNPSTNNKLDEWMHVTLNIGLTTPPAPMNATVAEHWIQILNEDRPYGGFGFKIDGQKGYWQIDNGDQTFTAGSSVTPFYDAVFSSSSATKITDDPTALNEGLLGAYLHFYTGAMGSDRVSS